MKHLNFEILRGDTSDEKTLAFLDEIETERNRISQTNDMSDDETLITLMLSGRRFTMRKNNAFSALDTYFEIFHKNNHFLHPEFFPKPAWTIVDFGANEGFYDARLCIMEPTCKIYAFEPNPFEFSLLKINMENNAFSNVTLDNHAIYSCDTLLNFECIPQIGPIGGICLRNPARKWLKKEFIHTIKVPAISPDNALTRYQINHVDLLKIDVEGSELEIMKHFDSLQCADRIVIEYHSAEARDELIELFHNSSFRHVFTDAEPNDYYGDLYFIREKSL